MPPAQAGTVEAAQAQQSPRRGARSDESQPLMMAEEGKGLTQSTPTTPGKQVMKSLASKLDAAEEERVKESDRAELQRALETMPMTAVSEANLHEVRWFDLGWEFSVNLIASVLILVAVAYLLWRTPRFLGKIVILPILCALLLGQVTVLVEIVLAYFKDPDGGCPSGQRLFTASPLVQAVCGKKVLPLQNTSDVYILAHALERHAREEGAFVERVVNPVNAELPRKVLTIGEEEIPPGVWKATGFRSDKKDYTEELMTAATGELYPTLSQVIEGWIFKDPSFKTPCYVELRPASRREYFAGLWKHWAFRLITNALMLTLFLMPAIRYINMSRLYKIVYCKKGKHQVLPVCAADKDGKTCEDACHSLLSFMGEVGSRIGVEEIEFIWTLCLAVVMIFIISIYFIRSKHTILVVKFVMGMGGISMAAEAEFIQVRSLLDDNLSFIGILLGLLRQKKAYQSKLKACEPLAPGVYKGSKQVQNQCFWEITRDWRNSSSGQVSCKPFSMPMSSLEHKNEDVHGKSQDLASWAEKLRGALQELATFKNAHGLSRRLTDHAQRDFKLCVSVPVTCRESLEILKAQFFTKKGNTGYADQLDAIFASADCQDNPPKAGDGKAGFCHVLEDFRVGPLLIPAGLCLTHIACQTEGNEVLSLEVGMGKDISTREAFLLLFHGTENSDLNKSLVLDHFSQKYHWPAVMLPSATSHSGTLLKTMQKDAPPVDSVGLAAKVKDAYIYQFNFVFQVSPSYFEALKSTEKDSEISLFGFVESIFTRLQESPAPEPTPSPDMVGHMDAIKKQSWKDAVGSQCCLVLEVDKSATFKKILSLLLLLFECIGLAILCMGFVMIVPLFRHFRWGSEIFPSPFTLSLALNAFVQLICLIGYFWLFSNASGRLEWIGKALRTFEDRTLAPLSDTDAAAADAGKAAPAKSASASSTTFREPSAQGDPFLLYVDETQDYNPTDTAWAEKFRKKEQAVRSWHLCARYMRVLVSRTRMTGQAILVCAAFILGVMVLVDLAQSLRGYGSLGIDRKGLFELAQNEALSKVQGLAQSEVDKASEVAKNFREGVGAAGAKALGGRRLLANTSVEAFDFGRASEALSAALGPVDAAVQRMGQRQLIDADTAFNIVRTHINVGDIQHVSQSNLLTIAMTLLLLIYGVYLLAKIATINDKVDKHESILVQVKEQHLHKQSERDALWVATKATADFEASESMTHTVDQARASYERMLDISIQSAHDNRGRFPLTLFSFVITQALLVAWLATALQPLINQLGEVVPQLAGDACNWIESTSVVANMEGTLQNASAGLGHFLTGNDTEAISAGDHSLIYSLVCVPLLGAIQGNMDQWNEDVENSKDEEANKEFYGYGQEVNDTAGDETAGDARRLRERRRRRDDELLSEASVRRLVEDWWDMHPGEPGSKLALVKMVLGERERSVRQILAAGPKAILSALRSGHLRPGAPRSAKRSSGRLPTLPWRRPAVGGEL